MLFVVQSEDGIRDLLRSRGVGEVYKRQSLCLVRNGGGDAPPVDKQFLEEGWGWWGSLAYAPVSYTHLTLPTSDLV